MHEYSQIKRKIADRLEELDFHEDVEDVELDVMGSMHCIYAKQDQRVMIGWDAEEGFGYAELWENDAWRRLRPIVPEGREDEFDAELHKLVSVIMHNVK